MVTNQGADSTISDNLLRQEEKTGLLKNGKSFVHFKLQQER